MFTLWYAHLLYKEYRLFMEKLHERRPLAIEAPPSTEDSTITEPDTVVRCEKTPNISREEYDPLIANPVEIEIAPDSDLSDNEELFQPIATSSPILRSISTSPVPNVSIEQAEQISVAQASFPQESLAHVSVPQDSLAHVSVPQDSLAQDSSLNATLTEDHSDPNRTPSFSEMVRDDPMLIISESENFQLEGAVVVGSTTHEDIKNPSQIFLESERSSGIATLNDPLAKNSNEERYDAEDEEDESDIEEEEEENSVISSTPISFGPTATSPFGSSIEIINHELNGEDD